jgi:hypothetical protein
MAKNSVKTIIPSDAERTEIQRAHEAMAAQQYAKSVRYDRRAKALRFVLRGGVEVAIPVGSIPYLKEATPAQLARVELYPTGEAIGLRELNVDLFVPSLVRDALGIELQQRRAARVKSAARAAAARANGKKGGRPRKAVA